jgi:hypothetical protein
MRIDDLRVVEQGDGQVERSARVTWSDGTDRLWIRLPAECAPPPGDASPFLAAGVALALRRGEDLEVEGAVSPRLLARSTLIQAIYRAWNPNLREVEIDAEADGTDPAGEAGADIASFFSRGVDSTYSAIAPRSPERALTRVIFADGLDLCHDTTVRVGEMEHAATAASALGLPMLVVATNMRELSEPLCDWEDMAGAGLAFIALSLAGGLRRVIVPASDSYASLTPCGTSPLLDPLFSTERVEIEHDELTLTRTGKVAAIVAQRPELLPELKVCYAENRVDNCGRCGKCLLTMAALQAAGALERATGFPDRIDLPAFDSFHLDAASWSARYEWGEVCRALPATGEAGATRERALTLLADPGPWVDTDERKPVETFRLHHGRTVLSLARDGRPYPPLGDAGPHRGWVGSRGLVRALDAVALRHVYAVGTLPPGRVVGELGALADRALGDAIPVWLTEDGRVMTADYRPEAARPSPRLVARWALAPLALRGFGPASARVRTFAWRLRRLVAGGAVPPAVPRGAPVGFLHREETPRRRPLYAAVHPVTGDQLLSSSAIEAGDMGYVDVMLLGFLGASAPVTGSLGTERPLLPWASRLGQVAR